MRNTKIAALAAGLSLSLTLAACSGGGAGSGDGDTDATAGGGETAAAEGGLIGVSMPTETSERWIADGAAVEDGLTEAGYEVSLQFAGDDIPTQSQQIDQMITQGVDLLIIAAIDGTALSGQLQAAADAGIPVISYDRLIRDSENVDFYVTFDNEEVGVQQATSLLVGLGILNEDGSEGDATGPFNIELFAGSLDDNNAHFFWKGAIDTLQPYIDEGTLVVKSGQTDIEQAATLRWSQETAQKRMEDLLTAAYGDGSQVDGVLSPFDGISRGIITALQNAGYGPGIDDGMPIVSGQDAEIASVKLIADGVQFATIFKDTRKLADQAVVTAEAYLAGEEPEANDTETYDNGVKVVPSFLLESDIVYADNIQPLLVDSGYYTAEQVESGQA
ncbi:multiple monosaccharide ABC transporter substrate-binding protein [Georgenia muralis]|uniref:Monosaccharide ABC transporter substrate-binding protein (CUT2 family) n=1 Tax=Georgenia muralis TaxID=154117 RepID=A0A3N5A6S2_9MICO|nr:multiple monosaccharide ABC transporter substrate-binding protein [Georgenia muralis]RPF27411.1 monosaccharide ABC transporter substrate-binding protein (CUT2 family) [Georgenia muralis]